MMSLNLATEADTKKLACKVAALLTLGDVVHLKGPLGSGKTTFARFLIQHLSPLGERELVASPTFSLVQVYDHLTPPIWHFDLYRLKTGDEVWELGLDEALATGIILVEWPDLVKSWPKKPKFTLTFEEGEPRRVLIQSDTLMRL